MNIQRLFLSVVVLLSGLLLTGVAAADDPVEIKMTSTWPSGISLIDADKHFAKTVNQLSDGGLKINFYPGGSLVSSGQVFDAVSSGSIDASADWPGYWAGNDSAFALLGSFPMMLTPGDYMLWLEQWGGYEAFQKVYGKYGMVYLPYVALSMESGLRSKEPLTSLADLKGKRLRMSGRPQGEILKKLGAAQVQLPGSAVYQALDRGVVDGAEFSSPGVDLSMGLQEVTDNWLVPGWHQPGSVGGVMINKKAWNKLSAEQQQMMKIAAQATMTWALAYYEKTAVEATDKILASGTKVHKLSDDELQRLQNIANGLMVKASCNNPLYAQVAYSQMKYLQDYKKWRSLEGEFAFGRNLSSMPDVAKIKSCLDKEQ